MPIPTLFTQPYVPTYYDLEQAFGKQLKTEFQPGAKTLVSFQYPVDLLDAQR